MMNLSFYTALCLLSLNQMVSVSKSGGLNIYLFDIGIGIFSLLGSFYFLAVKRSFKIPKYSVLFLIFLVIAISSLVLVIPNYSTSDLGVGFFYILRLLFYVLAGIVVYNMVDKGLLKKASLDNAFIYSGLALSLVGFIQLIILPDFTTLDSGLGWDPHKNRLASTFFDPNFLGAYLVMCIALLLEKFYPDSKGTFSKGNKKIEKKYYLYFFVILLALFFTFSRSAWGMLFVVILFYGLIRSRTLLYVAFFIAFLAYFAVPRIQTRISGITDPADSASLRLVSWGDTLKIAKDNFWFGVGFNTFRYVQKQYGFIEPGEDDVHSGAGSDSSLLFVLATTGIFGFLVYLFALILPALEAFSKKNNGWLVILALIVSFLLESQFINSLFYPQIMFFLFCLLFSFPSRT